MDGPALSSFDTSVSLLAATPGTMRIKADFDNSDWQEFQSQLEQALYSLRAWRMSWWAHWAALAEAILPRRYHWLITPNTMVRGSAINQSIVDPTASQAVRVCTAGMRSGLMSSSRPWFKIQPGIQNFNLDQAGLIYLQAAEQMIYSVMTGSNYYTTGTQMFEDLVVFGTAPKLMYEDRDDLVRCHVPCAGEYYLRSGPDGRVTSLYRTFVQTVMQVVQEFGLENCGPEVQSLWEQKGAVLETELVVAHAIEPNFSVQQPGQTPNLGVVGGGVHAGFPYREVFWLWGKSTNGPLRIKPHRMKPFIAPRWATTSNDPYGRSPGMDALPDVLQLHQMTRRQAEAIEKMVRPPMQADVKLKNQPSSILPGRVTYVQDVEKGGMKPIYEVEPQIGEMSALIEKIEKRVERWFYNDQFQMLANLEGVQPRNEMEIAERRGEKLQVLGPIVESVEQELAHDIRMIYMVLKRHGYLPPLPNSLKGVPISINIKSMIAIAQEAAETAVMERVAAVAAQLATSYPDEPATDNIDPDKFIQHYAKRTTFPADVMRSPQAVQQIRAQRAKAQAEAQQQAQAASAATHTAPALATTAKNISEIDPGGALNALQIAGLGGPQ